jgi:hypothetical protein
MSNEYRWIGLAAESSNTITWTKWRPGRGVFCECPYQSSHPSRDVRRHGAFPENKPIVNRGTMWYWTWLQGDRLILYPFVASNPDTREHCWLVVRCRGTAYGCDDAIDISRKCFLVVLLIGLTIVIYAQLILKNCALPQLQRNGPSFETFNRWTALGPSPRYDGKLFNWMCNQRFDVHSMSSQKGGHVTSKAGLKSERFELPWNFQSEVSPAPVKAENRHCSLALINFHKMYPGSGNWNSHMDRLY